MNLGGNTVQPIEHCTQSGNIFFPSGCQISRRELVMPCLYLSLGGQTIPDGRVDSQGGSCSEIWLENCSEFKKFFLFFLWLVWSSFYKIRLRKLAYLYLHSKTIQIPVSAFGFFIQRNSVYIHKVHIIMNFLKIEDRRFSKWHIIYISRMSFSLPSQLCNVMHCI